MRLIDITQDGAGILPNNHEIRDGFITDYIETCCIYIAYGEENFCLIHDTGQLKIDEIVDIIKECKGKTRIFCVTNPNFKSSIEIFKLHTERQEKITQSDHLNIDEIFKIDAPDEIVLCDKKGNIYTEASKIFSFTATLLSSPNKEKRKSINILNNLFLPRKSQLLPVDLQFKNSDFTPMPKLIKNIHQMETIARIKKREGDADYGNWLAEYRRFL